MGSSISALANSNQNAEVVEKLHMLNKMVVDKITASSDKMKSDARQDAELPVVAIVDTVEKYHVNVAAVPSSKISDALNDFVSGDYVGGLVNLVDIGLNQFLKNVSVGESEKTAFHIIYANNSLRLDYMMYNYKLREEGAIDKTKSAFCYYMQIGVLDLEKVNPEILLYEITKTNSDSAAMEKKLESLVPFAKDLYKTIRELQNPAKPESNALAHHTVEKGPDHQSEKDTGEGQQ